MRIRTSMLETALEKKIPGDFSLCLLPSQHTYSLAPFLCSLLIHGILGVVVWVVASLPEIAKREIPARPELVLTRVITLVPRPNLPLKAQPVVARLPVRLPVRPQPTNPKDPEVAAPVDANPTLALASPALQSPPEAPIAKAKPLHSLPVRAPRTRTKTDDLLLQLDFPELPAKNTQAPEMLLLNDIRNKRETYVKPADLPRQVKTPAVIKIDADVPSLSTKSDGVIAALTGTKAMLSLPRVSKFPVQIPDAEAPPQNLATVGGAGKDSPNIVSIPMHAVPRYDQVVLPPAQSGPVAAVGPAARPGERPVNSGESGVGGDRAGGSAGSGGTGPGSGKGVASPLPEARAQVRFERPKSGRYDFAITNAESGIPGAAGLLVGRPVYTVYVPVGTGREWVLQYASIDAAVRPRNGTVVTLDAPAPLAPPYAFVMLRPPVLRLRGDARYAFVHGVVNTSGKFEALKVVGSSGFEDAEELLRSLGQWEFRPATKDGAAVPVEVLLCIPNAG